MDLLAASIGPNNSIYWGFLREQDGGSVVVRTSRTPDRPLPKDAPPDARELAAKHWTPEVIQAAKDRAAGVRPK